MEKQSVPDLVKSQKCKSATLIVSLDALLCLLNVVGHVKDVLIQRIGVHSSRPSSFHTYNAASTGSVP